MNNSAREKKRHWVLLVYLVIIIFFSSYNAAWIFVTDIDAYLHLPVFDQPLVLFARSFWAIADTICAGAAIAIFRWKKWGFWLFSSMVLIQTILNLLMDSNWIITLLGVPMLYGVLHIGGDKKGWTQLE